MCSYYGISRFTLRKWYKRYELLGIEELHSLSRKPHTFPFQKLNDISEQQILVLRQERKLGARRIQNELKRLHNISFSTATIHKVLQKHNLGKINFKTYAMSKKVINYCKNN
ncbi:helix-turn-helix domain-containing protein [Rickettsia endosymbiont of Gonocerus acuteangulatus]|uniref:helix-turn-helix domain-containing protein n=1 Tax=Rickettsia endosymbiont of Gonocerus acuteangulatus TaxID=3066266 RepID=UPI003132AC96